MAYNIIVIKEKPNWELVEKLEVMEYVWGDTYMPHTQAQLVREDGKGFWLRMTCQESQPLAIYTKDNDPVYKDSCMEFFVNFYPERTDKDYINFEMNSSGAILCEYGQPGQRFYVQDKGIEHPKPSVVKREDMWEIQLFISDQFIEKIYGEVVFAHGHKIKANFYKCGDDTQIPHFGSWKAILNEVPAFHKPEFFGELSIGK